MKLFKARKPWLQWGEAGEVTHNRSVERDTPPIGVAPLTSTLGVMNIVRFGSTSEHVEIRASALLLAKGWGQAEVTIAVAGFHGEIAPWVDAHDFELFAAQLRALYDTLQGQAEFRPREEQFVLKLLAKPGGHIHVEGEAWSRATYENRLQFELSLDQTFLQEPLYALEHLSRVAQRTHELGRFLT